MQTIVPNLWFDREAKEAAAFYIGIFPNARVVSTVTLSGTPGGDTDIVTLELCGQRFQFFSPGSPFKFTPAISFRVDCASEDEVDRLWAALSAGGFALMPLGEYPFSRRYAWLQDRFGVSWQLMHIDGATERITPALMFVGEQCGRAEEAVELYTRLFPQSTIDHTMRYGSDEAPDVEGTIKQIAFTLARQPFAAMDSAHRHEFGFNEAISLAVYCETQAEIDRCWEALSAVPEAEQCGWLKDRFGISWQIVPTAMDAMMTDANPEALARVTTAFLAMKKFDLAALERAYAGTPAD